MSWADELAREISGRVLTDDAAREAMATDFGRIIVRRPQVVVCPASTEDVARVVKFAARNSFHVATRGAGHSQTGQSLSGQIVLDMTSFNQVTSVRNPNVLDCRKRLVVTNISQNLHKLAITLGYRFFGYPTKPNRGRPWDEKRQVFVVRFSAFCMASGFCALLLLGGGLVIRQDCGEGGPQW